MIVKNSINAINEFTQLTNDLLAQGYHILEVQSDPNKQQNQAIVLSKNIVPKKGQDIVVVFRITKFTITDNHFDMNAAGHNVQIHYSKNISMDNSVFCVFNNISGKQVEIEASIIFLSEDELFAKLQQARESFAGLKLT